MGLKASSVFFLLLFENNCFQIVGDVRGKGLMIGIEMVQDKESRAPLSPEKMSQIWEDCKAMKVLIGKYTSMYFLNLFIFIHVFLIYLGKGGLCGNVFRIKPPMCISQEDADYALEVFRTAVKNCK